MNAITLTLSARALVLISIGLALLLVLLIAWFIRHQRLLKRRAHLMREAVRNREFTFRLPVKGLWPGERALQQTLNDLGQDISHLVAENEVESWRRLIRVLTHEIMNTTAPICSISQAFLDSPAMKGSPYEEGIRAIHASGAALTAFTANFRKLTQLQPPVLRRVNVGSLARKIQVLHPDLQWTVSIPAEVVVTADEGMLLQVLTNLIRNACEAGATSVGLHFQSPSKESAAPGAPASCALAVSNNGAPIPADVLRNIFVPFFTTKPGGQGIGLALSRQLMLCQGGDLSVPGKPRIGWPVTFALTFSSSNALPVK